MKQLTPLLFAGLLIALTACQNSDQNAAAANGVVTNKDLTSLQWIDSLRDFGKIKEGQKLEVVFAFKNTGDKPLVIANVQPGCGCTVAEKPEAPIAPGEEGKIKAVFDSNGKPGKVRKSMTVTANTNPSSWVVYFEGEVEPKNPTPADGQQAPAH
jgi:hypothetical protein